MSMEALSETRISVVSKWSCSYTKIEVKLVTWIQGDVNCCYDLVVIETITCIGAVVHCKFYRTISFTWHAVLACGHNLLFVIGISSMSPVANTLLQYFELFRFLCSKHKLIGKEIVKRLTNEFFPFEAP